MLVHLFICLFVVPLSFASLHDYSASTAQRQLAVCVHSVQFAMCVHCTVCSVYIVYSLQCTA